MYPVTLSEYFFRLHHFSFHVMRRYGKRKRYTGKRKRSFKKTRKAFTGRVRRIVNRMEETKFITAYAGFNPTSAVPTIAAYNTMAKGTNRFERLGNRISLTELQFSFRATAAPTIVAGTMLRVIVFYDKQANSVGLIPTTTLGGLFLDPTIANWYFALRDPNTMRRFRAIYDRSFRIEANLATNVVAGATTTESSFQVFRRLRLKLKNRLTQFNDNNAALPTDIISPVLYVAMFTDAPGAGVIVNTEAMIKFKDA